MDIAIGILAALATAIALLVLRDLYYHFRYRRSEMFLWDPLAPDARRLVVMIHGTWGRRTMFLKHRNSLHNHLATELDDAQFASFMWSGANFIGSRRNAARDLFAHVAVLCGKAERADETRFTVADPVAPLAVVIRNRRSNPGGSGPASAPVFGRVSQVVLIAHSHGGNVAYEAAQELIREGVCRPASAAGVDLPEVCVAALATPFIVTSERRLHPLHVLSAAAIAALAWVCVAWPQWIADLAARLDEPGPPVPSTPAEYACTLVALVVSVLLASILARAQSRRVADSFPAGPRVIAISSFSDEAYAVISALKLADSLFTHFMRDIRVSAGSVAVSLAIGCGVLVIARAIIVAMQGTDVVDKLTVSMVYITLVCVALAAFLVLLSGLSSLLKFARASTCFPGFGLRYRS